MTKYTNRITKLLLLSQMLVTLISPLSATQCMTCTPFEEEPYGILKTAHAKVVLNFNQYYFGREIIAVIKDKNDEELQHYPDMEWVYKNRSHISQEIYDVLYATQDGRRDWLRDNGYENPELFNVLIGNNLAFGREKKLGQAANPHAHLHSFMRYSTPISIVYTNDFSDIRLLAPQQETPTGFTQITFNDTEFGNFFILDKTLTQEELNLLPEEEKLWLTDSNHRNRKLPAPIMKWMADNIATYSAPYLSSYLIR